LTINHLYCCILLVFFPHALLTMHGHRNIKLEIISFRPNAFQVLLCHNFVRGCTTSVRRYSTMHLPSKQMSAVRDKIMGIVALDDRRTVVWFPTKTPAIYPLKASRQALGSMLIVVRWTQGSCLYRQLNGSALKLTINFHLMPLLGMGGAIPPSFIWLNFTSYVKSEACVWSLYEVLLKEPILFETLKIGVLLKHWEVDCVWNVMEHAQKPDFVFRRNGRVHLNRRGRQFSRLLTAEECASAVVMLDTTCSEVVWRVMFTHCIRQFPLHFPNPCVTVYHHISTGLYQ